MASPAQIAANRGNALHSSGPVTPEGKARVAQNAVKHGLTAKNLVVRDDEREEFESLRDSLNAELDPQGVVETLTFSEVLHAGWNLQRLRRLEAEVSIGTMDDFTDPQTSAVLDRLTRYQSRAQRAWFRALAELRRLQTDRALRLRKLEPEEAAALPALVDINELTKQTHSEVTAEAMKQAINFMELETGVFLRDARHKRLAAQPQK